jgi:pimeloyl-ACP methyl ester carboxylesterase
VTPRLNLVRGEGNGRPIIFQHGLCGSAAQTMEVFPHDPRFRMLTLECRGHGTSETGPFDAFSIRTFAQDVAATIESECVAPCIVGGISMGAAISLHLAVHRSELVRALVLARPAWVTEASPDNMRPNAEVGMLLGRFPQEEAKIRFLEGKTAQLLAQEAPDNLASLIAFFGREPIAVTSALLTAISGDHPGVTQIDIRRLNIPTLIIATGQDHIHPLSCAQSLHGLIPSSRLEVITSKAVNRDGYVREFRRTMLHFLEENA